MAAFKGLLVLFFLGILSFTAAAITKEGWDLITVFFGDLSSWTWRGQFNFDFSTYIILSGLWIAWRHKFSVRGLLLAAAAPLGMLFLAPYLFVATLNAKGNTRKLFLGEQRH